MNKTNKIIQFPLSGEIKSKINRNFSLGLIKYDLKLKEFVKSDNVNNNSFHLN